MTTQRISSINLLRDTFDLVGAIYPDLFRINYPHLIYFVGDTLGRAAMVNMFDITTTQQLEAASVYGYIFYWCVAVPFLWGATSFYIYRSVTGNQVTASNAFIQAKRKFLPLFWVYFLSVGVLFAIMWILWSFASVSFMVLIIIIPALYVSYRLSMFSFYATVIDNYSVLDSFKSSWKLTERFWWLVFRSSLLIFFVFFMPATLIPELIGLRLENLLASQLVGYVLGLIAGLLMNVYLVLLYLRLRESAATIQ